MLRGMTLFRCDKCGKIFLAPDIEYAATALSCPQRCPSCKSMHTLPLGAFIYKSVYKKIWADLDKKE